MVALRGRIGRFRESRATVLGVSADSAFSLGAFRGGHDLEFDLASDTSGAAIREDGVERAVPELGLYGSANRTVTYRRVADDPANGPEYDELLAAVRDV